MKNFHYYIILIVLISNLSCTKESIDPGDQNRIESYTVETAEGNLYGAIDHEVNSITVYIPFYYEFPIIEPIIKLSNNARLAEEYDAIPVDSIGHQYKVIGADQSTRTYTLNIETTIPRPLWVEANANPYIGYNANIYGNFTTKNPKEIQGFIIDEANNEYPFVENPYSSESSYSITPRGGNAYNIAGFFYPKELKENTNYKIRVRYRGEVIDSKQWFQMTFFQVQFNNTMPYNEVKRGQEYTATVQIGAMVPPKRVFTKINNVETDIPIVSHVYDKLVIKIPENMPLGIDYNVRVQFENSKFWDAQIIFNVTE